MLIRPVEMFILIPADWRIILYFLPQSKRNSCRSACVTMWRKMLAEKLLEEYRALGVPIRSVVFREGSHGDYYYTNRAAASLYIPALTSEFCFIDNAEDQQFIDSEEDLQAEARAQYNAIMYYFTQVEY